MAGTLWCEIEASIRQTERERDELRELLRPFADVGRKLRMGEARQETLEVVVALMLGAAGFERAADLLYPEETR